MIGPAGSATATATSPAILTPVGKHPDALGLTVKLHPPCGRRPSSDYASTGIDLLGLDGDDPSTPIEADFDRRRGAHRLRARSATSAPRTSGGGAARRGEDRAPARDPGHRGDPPEYNLLERRQYESEIAPIAVAADLGVLVRTPLANGYLRGDFRSRHDKPASPIFQGALKYVNRRGAAVLSVLDDIADECGQHVGRIALRGCTRPHVAAPVVRVPSARALADLLPGASLELTPTRSPGWTAPPILGRGLAAARGVAGARGPPARTLDGRGEGP